jgi:superfamily I DNA/RNA helicase
MDEAQDLNPVMLSWIIQQTKAGKRVLLIGDTHQAIYSFRNATNAMDWASQRAAQTFPLTESWRFGEAVANAASRLLSDYKGDRVLLKGRGPKKESSDKTTCILARTNGTLLHQAIRIGRRQKIHFAATNEKTGWTPRHAYRFQEMEDAASLMCGRQLIKGRSSALIGQYANWDELHAAAMPEDGNGDPALASIVKFVLDAGATEIPYLLREIEQSSVGPDEAEIHFSSAHRSKGKEWHRVHLQDDFPPLDNEDRMKKFVAKKGASGFAEEINLLYVAVTRGCHGLTPYESASNYFASVGITAPPPSKPLTAIAAFAARRASQKRTRLF